jgi:hypothetical protein
MNFSEVVVVCVRVLVIVRKVVAAALVLMDENACAVSGSSINAHTALFLNCTIFEYAESDVAKQTLLV